MAEKTSARRKLKSRNGFTQIYNACIDSDMLSLYEKLVFITIKSYADRQTNQAFPSLIRISSATGMSVRQVQRCIARLEEIGLLDVERRKTKASGNIQNLYTVHDSQEIWKVSGSEEEDLKAVMEEISDEKFREEAKRRGYILIKEKELDSTTDQSMETSALKDNSVLNNDNENLQDRQEYSIEDLKDLYTYDWMVQQEPLNKELIEYVIQIVHQVVNSEEPTVRIRKTVLKRETVKAQLLALTHEEILYVIQKYKEQTGRIANPEGYLLSMLYTARGQMRADIDNQVRNDQF